jgi:hypothetical protein
MQVRGVSAKESHTNWFVSHDFSLRYVAGRATLSGELSYPPVAFSLSWPLGHPWRIA